MEGCLPSGLLVWRARCLWLDEGLLRGGGLGVSPPILGAFFSKSPRKLFFFWETTSGWIPYSALLGWTVDTCVRQVTEALWFRLQKTAESPQLQFIVGL